MSYLRGPLTPTQITSLTPDRPVPAKAGAPSGTLETTAAPAVDDSNVAIMPPVADGIAVFHLDPAAEWSESVGSSAVPTHYEAGAAVRIVARYDDTRAGVDHVVEWEAVVFPLSNDTGDPIEVDHDSRDFVEEDGASVPYELPAARIDTKTFWSSLSSGLKERMYREGKVTILKNATLKMYSRVGESRGDFVLRCDKAADDAADDATAKLRDKYEKRLRRIQLAIDKYGAQADAAAQDARSGDIDLVTGTVFDMLSGRSRSRSISSATKARRTAQRKVNAATDRVEAKVAEYEVLQEEFQEEVADLVAAWDEKAADVEEVTIGLEKTDITVSDAFLVWIPRD